MKEIYACSNCGVSETNRNDWCDLGCGSDYNEMIDVSRRRFIDYSINIKNKLDLIINKLPLVVDGHRLKIWREKDNTSWDVAYNTDSGNLKPIVWEQARYLSEAVDQMLKKLNDEEYVDCECSNCGTKMRQPQWLLDKYKKEDDAVYCSEQCRYNAETGHPGEEY